MKPIRMGIVGVGGISRVHIHGIAQSRDAELVAICDSNTSLLNTVGDRENIPTERRFDSYEALFQSGLIDAVSICTPNFMHFPVAMAAAKAGIPFCVEKPVAMNANEAHQLLDVVRQNHVLTMVSFSYRYKASARYARWLIQNGQLGSIHHIYGKYLQGWGIHDVPMSWRFSKDLAGSGAIGDLGCHLLDLSRFLIGDITSVMATADTITKERTDPATGEPRAVDVDDFCHVFAKFDTGATGVFNISRFAYGRGNYQRVEVYGSKGALVYELEHEDTLQVCIGPAYEKSHQFTQVPVPGEFRKDQMQSFFDLVLGRGDGLSATMEDGYVNQRMVDGVIQSFTDEKWVRVGEGEMR